MAFLFSFGWNFCFGISYGGMIWNESPVGVVRMILVGIGWQKMPTTKFLDLSRFFACLGVTGWQMVGNEKMKMPTKKSSFINDF